MAAAGLGSERAGVQQTLALGARFKGPCNCNKRLEGRMAVGADAIDAQGRQKVSAMVPSSSSKEEREEGSESGFFVLNGPCDCIIIPYNTCQPC